MQSILDGLKADQDRARYVSNTARLKQRIADLERDADEATAEANARGVQAAVRAFLAGSSN